MSERHSCPSAFHVRPSFMSVRPSIVFHPSFSFCHCPSVIVPLSLSNHPSLPILGCLSVSSVRRHSLHHVHPFISSPSIRHVHPSSLSVGFLLFWAHGEEKGKGERLRGQVDRMIESRVDWTRMSDTMDSIALRCMCICN